MNISRYWNIKGVGWGLSVYRLGGCVSATEAVSETQISLELLLTLICELSVKIWHSVFVANNYCRWRLMFMLQTESAILVVVILGLFLHFTPLTSCYCLFFDDYSNYPAFSVIFLACRCLLWRDFGFWQH